MFRGALLTFALLVLAQAIPYGRDHTNPPVTKAARFPSAKVAQIVTDSCADCHSNVTKWPWYTIVAPVSWLVQSDVDGGRQRLNFSQWDNAQSPVAELVDKIRSGEMPPLKYRVMPNHKAARLSASEKQTLIDGLRRLYASDPPAAIRPAWYLDSAKHCVAWIPACR